MKQNSQFLAISLPMHPTLANIDMLCIILSYLDIFDLLSVQQTSQKFRQVSRKVIEMNVGYYFGFLISKRFEYLKHDILDVFSRIELPYDILSAIIKANEFGICAHTNTGYKGRDDSIFDKNELYDRLTSYGQLEPDKLPYLHYKKGYDNLLVVYSFQESKKSIRIYRDQFRGHTLVVCGNLDDSILSSDPFLLWKNAEMMFVIHNDFTKEKTLEGKYYITWKDRNEKIREECHLISFHYWKFSWKVDSFFPKNRESLIRMNPAYISYFTKKHLTSCGFCLSKSEIEDSKCILDLLGETDNENRGKKRKLSNSIDVSTGQMDVPTDPLEDCIIQMGINHYCNCVKRASPSNWIPDGIFLP